MKYTLSGAAIQPEWNTIYVATFPNYAPQQNPTLSQDLTIAIQDIFRNRTKLKLNSNENSDLIIEGEITGYDVFPTLFILFGVIFLLKFFTSKSIKA